MSQEAHERSRTVLELKFFLPFPPRLLLACHQPMRPSVENAVSFRARTSATNPSQGARGCDRVGHKQDLIVKRSPFYKKAMFLGFCLAAGRANS